MDITKSKRGVSPLIATVLLIAFAVSLGAVVINLGINVFGDPCVGRTIDVLSIEGGLRVCHLESSKALAMTVVNSGTKPLDGFKLNVVGDTAYNEDILGKLDPLEKKVISYPLSDMTRIDLVSITPLFEKQGQTRYCPANTRDYAHVPKC